MDSSSTDPPNILILNNDCLLEVFGHLNLVDLCVVADVCSRFRQNAILSFVYSKKTNLNLWCDISIDRLPVHQFVLKTSRILRHLGRYFTKINEFQACLWNIKNQNGYVKSRALCARKIFYLVTKYCSGTLSELRFNHIELDEEIMPVAMPLLGCLHTLDLYQCRIDQVFLDLLPQWASNLRELKLRLSVTQPKKLQFDCLHHPFEHLVNISLMADDLHNNDFDEMLKHNPNMKKIEISDSENLDGRIFRSIVNHAPEVEFLSTTNFLLQPGDAFYFGQMSKLQTLKLGFDGMNPNLEHILPVIRQIVAANIQLKRLYLDTIDFNRYANELVEEVLKFKKLEILFIREFLGGLTKYHLRNFYTHSTELRELRLFLSFVPSLEFISQTIRTASKLKILFISSSKETDEKICVDLGTHKTWTEIVGKRRDKTNLFVLLNEPWYTTNMTPLPRRRNKRPFLLKIGTNGLNYY